MGNIISYEKYTKERGKIRMCAFVDNLRKQNPKDEKAVIECAKQFLNEYKRFISEDKIDIVSVMNDIGIYTCQAEMDMDAFIAVDAEFAEKYGTTKVACVRQDKSNGFKRFAFAHELAHHIFDYNEERELKYYNTYNKELGVWTEKRANIFAKNVNQKE